MMKIRMTTEKNEVRKKYLNVYKKPQKTKEHKPIKRGNVTAKKRGSGEDQQMYMGLFRVDKRIKGVSKVNRTTPVVK